MLRSSARALLFLAVSGCAVELPEPESPGAKLYVERCSSCHRLSEPRSMTAEMWKVMVRRMQGVMARGGARPLDAAEEKLLLEYLERHAG